MAEQHTPGGLMASGIFFGGMATVAWQVGESGQIAAGFFGLGGCILFLRGVHLAGAREWEIAKWRRGLRKLTDLGGAKWATLKEVRALGLLGRKGIYLGRFRGREIRYTGAGSVGIVAQTRSGKGTDYLLQTLTTDDGNMVLADPKGELAFMTAACRRDLMGHAVYFVNPWGLWGLPNNPYNPLSELTLGDRNIRAYAAAISAALLPESARPGEISSNFWVEHGRCINTGLMLYLKSREPENCTLMRLRALTHLPPGEFKALFETMAAVPPGSAGAAGSPFVQLMREFAGATLNAMDGSGPQHAGVLAEAVRATEPFDDLSMISDSLRRSDFSFRDLRRKKMTVYIMIPSDKIRIYNRWYQLLIDLAVEMAVRETAETTEEKPRNLTVVLDEFQNIGYVRSLGTAFAEYAGLGVRFLAVLQDFGRLTASYGRDTVESIVANCDCLVFFGGDPTLTERIRRMAGRENFAAAVPSISEPHPGGRPRVSYGLQRMEPDLVRASHIRRTARRGGRAIVLIGGAVLWTARRPIFRMPWLHGRWRPTPLERHRLPGPLRRAWYMFTDGFSRAVEAREDPDKI